MKPRTFSWTWYEIQTRTTCRCYCCCCCCCLASSPCAFCCRRPFRVGWERQRGVGRELGRGVGLQEDLEMLILGWEVCVLLHRVYCGCSGDFCVHTVVQYIRIAAVEGPVNDGYPLGKRQLNVSITGPSGSPVLPYIVVPFSMKHYI